MIICEKNKTTRQNCSRNEESDSSSASCEMDVELDLRDVNDINEKKLNNSVAWINGAKDLDEKKRHKANVPTEVTK